MTIPLTTRPSQMCYRTVASATEKTPAVWLQSCLCFYTCANNGVLEWHLPLEPHGLNMDGRMVDRYVQPELQVQAFVPTGGLNRWGLYF